MRLEGALEFLQIVIYVTIPSPAKSIPLPAFSKNSRRYGPLLSPKCEWLERDVLARLSTRPQRGAHFATCRCLLPCLPTCSFMVGTNFLVILQCPGQLVDRRFVLRIFEERQGLAGWIVIRRQLCFLRVLAVC